jgi:predicted nucleic acid-binding protein
MIAAVDTNVLLDVLTGGDVFLAQSKALLESFKARGQLVFCEAVYAELASQFPLAEEMARFLAETSIILLRSEEATLLLAGARWRAYASGRPRRLQCPRCGHSFAPVCPDCGADLSFRRQVIGDFYVGAHALRQADVLLSRDRGFYGSHFKDLHVVDRAA